jgi:hypothetical protein
MTSPHKKFAYNDPFSLRVLGEVIFFGLPLLKDLLSVCPNLF